MASTGELRVEPSEVSTYSEEKTEPFSQSEIEARLRSFRAEAFGALAGAVGAPRTAAGVPVHLDDLVVPPDQGIRILMRPLSRNRSVSPSSADNCQWLALRAQAAASASAASVDQLEHKVLAVTQTARDIKFIVNITSEQRDESLLCELYYDPDSDNQILINKSDVPMVLTRISQQSPPSPGRVAHVFHPGMHKGLSPGTWRITVDETEVLDFRILEKRPARLLLPSATSEEPTPSTLSPSSSSATFMVRSRSDTVISTGKRSFSDEIGGPMSPGKKVRGLDSAVAAADEEDKGFIVFLKPPGNPLVLPLPTGAKGKEVALIKGQPLLDLQTDEIVVLDGSHEDQDYQIQKHEHIAASTLSSVFTATVMSHPDVPPDHVVAVKVLKTRLPVTQSNRQAALAAAYPQQPAAAERNVIRQADIWLREYQAQNELTHSSIVRLYGGDARYLSLYMEHVDARDLAARGVWRVATTDKFAGTRSDALHILRDVAAGLAYVHKRRMAHNDVKPGNILYSRERGAVLCDFGLATSAAESRSTPAGTPYYIPPEFIGGRLRGIAGDVWALGVTMLYVLRRLVYPESRQRHDRPKPSLYWQIAEVNRPPAPPSSAARGGPGAGTVPAVMQMQQWLIEVREARSRLIAAEDRLEWLVERMLMPSPRERITMDRVVSEFREANSGS